MIDLSTTYLGMRLRTPLVAAASPISRNVELARQLEEAGLGAIVMYSLFEEQIIQNSLEIDRMLSHGAESFAEALSYFPEHGVYSVGPERYLEQVAALKKALSIPVIGSLNGVSAGGWVHYARLIQEAGADALELNIYFIPVDTSITSSELRTFTSIWFVQYGPKSRSRWQSRSVHTLRLYLTLPPAYVKQGQMRWCSSIAFTNPTSISNNWKYDRTCN